DKTLIVVPQFALNNTFIGHSDFVCAVKLIASSHSKQFVSGSYDKSIRLWNSNSNNSSIQVGQHQNYVYCVDVSRNGDLIVSSSYDKTVSIWKSTNEGAKWTQSHQIKSHSGSVYG